MNTIKEKTIELYISSERTIFWIRHQNYARASRYLQSWISNFSDFAKLVFSEKDNISFDYQQITDNLNSVLIAQKNDDYILIADILDNNTISILSNILSQIESSPSVYSDGSRTYNLIDSFLGSKTIKIDSPKKTYYLHSVVNPIREALSLTDTYFDSEATGYIVFGLGLGYFPLELYLRSDQLLPVNVFECDKIIYDISVKEGYLSSYLNDRLTIDYDPALTAFIKEIEKHPDYTVIIHAPSINNIYDNTIRMRLNELFIHDSSIRDQKCSMLNNFRNNILECNHYVDELSETFKDKDVYVVAAGPSLDKNIHLLKEKPSNSIILAVGAVYKKLVSENIKPDFVVFLDASYLIYNQLKGLEKSDTPLIIVSTAYYKIASDSICDKYLLCQKEYSPSEEYANTRNLHTYETGGSVSTISFDLAVKLGAKRVITLGLDLSFTNDGKLHADNAGIEKIPTIESKANEIQIDGFFGDKVYTTPSFELYRQWFIRYIENLKKDHNNKVQLINATEGGCYIQGMEHKELSSVILSN